MQFEVEIIQWIDAEPEPVIIKTFANEDQAQTFAKTWSDPFEATICALAPSFWVAVPIRWDR